MSVNTVNGNEPFFEVWGVPPGADAPVPVNAAVIEKLGALPTTIYPAKGDPGFGGYSAASAANGFTVYGYDAQSAGLSNYAWSSIYFGDLNEDSDKTFQDLVDYAKVNGIGVVPNVQPTPEFDCMIDL